MLISFVSDVHLEFHTRFKGRSKKLNFSTPDADVLVLAGDIFVYNTYRKLSQIESITHEFFNKCIEKYENIVYVLGNHEFYNGEIDEVKAGVRSLFPNIHLLDDEIVRINGMKFIGSTLWTDVNNNNPVTSRIIRTNMNDFQVIKHGDERFTPEHSYNIHKKSIDFISKEVNEECIVVTHHSPSVLSVDEKYNRNCHDLQINHGYYTNLETFIMDNTKIKLWIHGHMHNQSDYEIGETRVVCNPLGYYGNSIKPKVVEI